MSNSGYQICSRCVMDTSAVDIKFDELGVCSYCSEFLDRMSNLKKIPEDCVATNLSDFVRDVKERNRNSPYDCIVGLSGGVDSSYVLIKAVECGLRPLAVHMDNGWNSELAQNNIAQLVKKLDVDLVTHVIEWDEYRRLMQCFFDADVVDVELLYDNAMLAVNYHTAKRFGVKTILGGTNQSTEGLKIPKSWNNFKFDSRNIKDIAKKYRINKFETYPSIGLVEWLKCEYMYDIKWVHFLDKFDYKKDLAIAALVADYNYKPYPYKHYESVFTRFYQGFLLIEKFHIDKRKVHFSSLILTSQMTREDALQDLSKKYAYADEYELKKDLKYFLKKMKWSEQDLENYLRRRPISHRAYKSSRTMYDCLIYIYKLLSKLR